MPISALIICRNEELVIERCLKSLQGVVDEIILIHDGPCKDSTIKIARLYTNLVIESDVARGLNNSWFIDGIEMCHGDWILIIDADEFLSDELRQNLRKLTNNPNIDAYSFIWPMWDGRKYISKRALRKNFLFKKNRIGFLDKFHYPVKILGTICESNHVMHHMPAYNNWTNEVFDRKQKVWATLQARDHLKPIDECRILRLNKDDLIREQNRKTRLYSLPVLTWALSYLDQFKRLAIEPMIILDRGFWISAKFSAKYSYHVAHEVKRLKHLSTKIEN